jgi:hypothetical protein
MLWLALLSSSTATAAAAAATGAAHAVSGQHNATSKPVRFFIDEGYFLEGDTEILRAYITGEITRH